MAITDHDKGGFLLALAQVPFKELRPVASEKSLRIMLEEAIAGFVDPNATAFENPDDPSTAYNVKARVIEMIDREGLEHDAFNRLVAKGVWDGSIKIGFYKICRCVSRQYAESREDNP